jgi:uncharacterized repeat protein (TIGR01451 family)
MLSSITDTSKFIIVTTLMILTLFLFIALNGCNFDPYKDSAEQGDTATYTIKGTVRNTSKVGISKITVSLYDPISGLNSPRETETDTNGTYTLTTLFVRRDSLQMIFRDRDPNNKGNYDSLNITVKFPDIYFDHQFSITQDAELFE